MENSTNGAIAGTRGIRVAQLDMATAKPWAPARPAVLAGLPVITRPVTRVPGAEVCPSPDQSQVTPSFQAFGASAERYVPTSKGSIRPAPPG